MTSRHETAVRRRPARAFKTYKDTTFAMMREAAARGHELLACEPKDLLWERDGRVSATVRAIRLSGDAHAWFSELGRSVFALADADAVLMRKGPALRQRVFLRHAPAAAGRT
jgi:glutathione synthase